MPEFSEPRARPPMHNEVAFHGGLYINAAQPDDVVFKAYNPGEGDDMAAPGSGRQYRVEVIHISVSAGTPYLALLNDDGFVWGPHYCPVGFYSVDIGSHVDKSRSGKALGEGKTPRLTAAGTFTGRVDIFGYSAPVLSRP